MTTERLAHPKSGPPQARHLQEEKYIGVFQTFSSQRIALAGSTCAVFEVASRDHLSSRRGHGPALSSQAPHVVLRKSRVQCGLRPPPPHGAAPGSCWLLAGVLLPFSGECSPTDFCVAALVARLGANGLKPPRPPHVSWRCLGFTVGEAAAPKGGGGRQDWPTACVTRVWHLQARRECLAHKCQLAAGYWGKRGARERA